MRPLFPENKINPKALEAMSKFHPQMLEEVQKAIQTHDWVIVGMALNPVVTSARKHLDSKGIKYHYIGKGSYFSGWKLRLAIKLWTGWPTFPQVFHKGSFVGGGKDLKNYLP